MAKSNSLAGKLGTDFLHDRGHTGAGLFGGIMTGVVLTDHHDGECRCRGREIALVEAPRTCSVPLMPRFNAWRGACWGPRGLSPVSHSAPPSGPTTQSDR